VEPEMQIKLERYEAELSTAVVLPKRGILFGDFGQSVAAPTVSVADKIAAALPVTIFMSFSSILTIYGLAIPLGVLGAFYRNRWQDRLSSLLLFALYSLPNFWVAILLIRLQLYLPKSWQLPIQGLLSTGSENLPTLDYLWEMLRHLILPVLALSYAGLAGIARYMRSSMIEELQSDYVCSARAKGGNELRVVWRHALRNALIPIVTFLGGLLPALISGSFIIESIFGIPGMGYLSYTAILSRDYTVLMATLSMSAVLLCVGLLLSDLLYHWVDPRISIQGGYG
jgi:peptide/nickel transport system permease protein